MRVNHTAPPLCSLKTLLLMLLILCQSPLTSAHEIAPSVLTLNRIDAQHYELSLEANLEALMLLIAANHEDSDDSPVSKKYNQFRAMSAEMFEQRAKPFAETAVNKFSFTDSNGLPIVFNAQLTDVDVQDNSDLSVARDSRLSYHLQSDAPIEAISFAWPAELGSAVFRVQQSESLLATLWLTDGQRSTVVVFDKVEQVQTQSLLDYVVIGFQHILPLGLDHILFVIGLYLLSQNWRTLLIQVSAFTLAHTITLALATLGVVNVPSSIVEPLIAASIAYVAIENLFRHKITRLRVAVVFLFGLLHGLGFAGVLGEIGLNSEAFIPSLIAFNVGVELGQLAVIGGMYLFLGAWFSNTAYWEHFIRSPLSILIAMVGCFWLFQRVGFI